MSGFQRILFISLVVLINNCSTIHYKEVNVDNFANLRISMNAPEFGDKYRIDSWLYEGASLEKRTILGRFTSIVGSTFPPITRKSKFMKVPTKEALSLRMEGQIFGQDLYIFRQDILFYPQPNKMYEVEITVIDKFPVGKYDSRIYEMDMTNKTRFTVESTKTRSVDIPLKLRLPPNRAI